MKVTSLEISNFRGIRQARFAFHKRLNVFAGANGSGKTSLLTCLAMLLSRLTVPIAAPHALGGVLRERTLPTVQTLPGRRSASSSLTAAGLTEAVHGRQADLCTVKSTPCPDWKR